MEPETFEQFAKRLNLCKVCAGSKIDPKSNTGSPDDNHWACVACLGTGKNLIIEAEARNERN